MKVTTVPIQKPEVVITLSWEEAQILINVCGGIGGGSNNQGHKFTEELYDQLRNTGFKSQYKFAGKFK